MECSKRMKNNGGCCRDEAKMLGCAMTALEKTKDMFEAALGNMADTACKSETLPSGCVMDNRCQFQRCPFRGNVIKPNVLQTFCNANNEKKPPTGGHSDRDAMRLLPGEVGLRGDRATFHLGQGANQPVPVAEDGRPTGTVYYNMRAGAPVCADGRRVSKNLLPQRKHVMQVLPTIPFSPADPAVGPVTGIPIGDDEHVFLLRLGKRYEEPEEKARMQIEVRLPKKTSPSLTEAHTQFLAADVPTLPADKNDNRGKNKAGGKTKAGRKKSAGKKSAAAGSKKKKGK